MRRIESEQPELTEPDCPVESAALIYFDLETTGLHPERGAEITEAALLDDGGLRFHWHRRSTDTPLGAVLENLVDHLAAGVVVGHNVTFDFDFLAYEAARRDLRGPRLRFVDTLSLAHELDVGSDSNQLETLLDDFHIEPEGELHTARVDVQATKELFWRLVDTGGFETLGDLGISQLDWSTV